MERSLHERSCAGHHGFPCPCLCLYLWNEVAVGLVVQGQHMYLVLSLVQPVEELLEVRTYGSRILR